MPLPENLLSPISEENSAGVDLYYDNLFHEIKDARREDDDKLPEGDLKLKIKKRADHRKVIKLSSDALAKRTKDIRLAGWLIESLLLVEGFPILVPGIELLKALQETFWDGIHPEIEEGNDLELRAAAVESAGELIRAAVRKIPLTLRGFNSEDYLESRAVGYEAASTTDEQRKARTYALEHGKVSPEEFDDASKVSPKSLYVNADATLTQALEALAILDQFQGEKYGKARPKMASLREGLEAVHGVAETLLNERKLIEPDPVRQIETPASDDQGVDARSDESGETYTADSHAGTGRQSPRVPGELRNSSDAYSIVVECAQFLFSKDPKSPVPYLMCTGLRLGETRMQGPSPSPGFAVGPTPQIRQSLRALSTKGAWTELMAATLPILASECARAWLDLHRYIWRAGQETGAPAVSEAVAGTIKSLLTARPEIRHWTLEDDTGAANPETQTWIDTTVMK
jgi:type VI secretion system protein ImpA